MGSRSASSRSYLGRRRCGAAAGDTAVFGGNTDDIEYPNHSFTLLKQSESSKARLGKLCTPHGDVETPAFIFCATKAAIKAGITPAQLREEGTQFILSNTYHLLLTPGSEVVEKMGGLQQYSAWKGPMLTDSGGYQIFSMGYGSVSNEVKGKRNAEGMGWERSLIKIDEDGATFRSYVDGSIQRLTPERCMQVQKELGADFVVVLDECTPFNVDKQYTADSTRRSHRWALRSLTAFNQLNKENGHKQALYGIVQGGIYDDLRDESTSFINENPFFGIAIGGSLGDTRQAMHDIVSYTRAKLRDDRPVHLLGIGGVRDIFHGVRQGIDTFDCVHPSRLGRHAGALVKSAFWEEEIWHDSSSPSKTYADNLRASKIRKKEEERARDMGIDVVAPHAQHAADGRKKKKNDGGGDDFARAASKVMREHTKVREHVNVAKASFRNDPRPIDSRCSCYTCRNYSRAYLHHLFKSQEALGGTLVTLHNINFMNTMMTMIRTAIEEDTLDTLEGEYVHEILRDDINR